MMIGIPTDSSFAAFELETRLRDFLPVVQAGSDDGCMVVVHAPGPRLKQVLETVIEWAGFWSHGEVELMLGRRRYRMGAERGRPDWIDISETSTLVDEIDV